MRKLIRAIGLFLFRDAKIERISTQPFVGIIPK